MSKHQVNVRGNGCHTCNKRLTARNRSVEPNLCYSCYLLEESLREHEVGHKAAGKFVEDCCHCVIEKLYG